MINYEFKNSDGKLYKRVTLSQAKKAYKNGLNVVLCASKIRPFNIYYLGYAEINKKSRLQFVLDDIGLMNDFNNYINSFSFYNCNSECGKKVFFYIPANNNDEN